MKQFLLCIMLLLYNNNNYPSVQKIIGLVASCVILKYVSLAIAKNLVEKAIKEENYTHITWLKRFFPSLFQKGGIVPRMLRYNNIVIGIKDCRYVYKKIDKKFLSYVIDIGTYIKPESLLHACKKNDTELVKKYLDAGVIPIR